MGGFGLRPHTNYYCGPCPIHARLLLTYTVTPLVVAHLPNLFHGFFAASDEGLHDCDARILSCHLKKSSDFFL